VTRPRGLTYPVGQVVAGPARTLVERELKTAMAAQLSPAPPLLPPKTAMSVFWTLSVMQQWAPPSQSVTMVPRTSWAMLLPELLPRFPSARLAMAPRLVMEFLSAMTMLVARNLLGAQLFPPMAPRFQLATMVLAACAPWLFLGAALSAPMSVTIVAAASVPPAMTSAKVPQLARRDAGSLDCWFFWRWRREPHSRW